MPDTDTAPAEQDDQAAQTAPDQARDAEQPAKGDDDRSKPGEDDKDWKAEAAKWKNLARKHEANWKQAAPAAQKLAELEDAQKSEAQKLSDQLAAREVELAELRVEKVRSQAGRDAKLDPELWEFITASDPDEAAAQAKRLAARVAAPEPGRADLRQGARTPAKHAANPSDALRALLGHPQ